MENPQRMSRREALRLIGKATVAGGSVLGLWALAPEPTKIEVFETVSQTAVFTAAELLTAPLVHGIKAPIGSRVSEEDIRVISRASLGKMIYSSLISIIPQEVLRWIPHSLLPNTIAERWQTNLIQGTIFAMVGNAKYVSKPESQNSIEPDYFPNQKLPVYQVAENMFFWDILRGKGLLHSIAAHSLNVFSKLLVSKALYRILPTAVTSVAPIVTEAMVADSVNEGLSANFSKKKSA